MKKYYYKWKENLLIEVWVTHKVSDNKKSEFNKNGYPLFEIQISQFMRKKLNLDSMRDISKEKISRAVDYMKKMFENTQRIFGLLD